MSGYPAIAAVVVEQGGPFELHEVEVDEPRPDEVLVRVVAGGLCQADLSARDGHVPFPLPGVVGHEGSGVVEAIGDQVEDLAVGDHVVMSFAFCGSCRQCIGGHPAYCDSWPALNLFSGARPDGSTALRLGDQAIHGNFFGQSSFSTRALAVARTVVRVPQEAPLELLGPLACGIQTGAEAIFEVLRPVPGETLAVFGAGAVGLSAVIAAVNLSGASVIAVDVKAERLQLAARLGATHVVDAGEVDAVEALLEITAGRGCDLTLEASGAPGVSQQAIESLAPLGRCGIVGGGGRDGEASFNTLRAIVRGVSVVGINQGDSIPRTSIPKLIDLFERGRFPYDQLLTFYPYEQIEQAAEDVARGTVTKAVIRLPE